MPSIPTLMNSGPVIPVIEIEHEDDALPLGQALLAGGVQVLEITLRTPAALGAIARLSQNLPDAYIGAGTVLTPGDVKRAKEAGAQFAISPGLTRDLAETCTALRLPLLPGAVTATELMLGREMGFRQFKFFPAASSGGAAAVKAFSGPFPDVAFCPTGGVSAETAAAYLSLPNVPCVGGSWLAPKALIAERNWTRITELARATRELKA
jgi:2-dehydro-3-deoxyphosphogluconate aldolase / (4S)-4-hydroxy-2-oxoglutarate aldolase